MDKEAEFRGLEHWTWAEGIVYGAKVMVHSVKYIRFFKCEIHNPKSEID